MTVVIESAVEHQPWIEIDTRPDQTSSEVVSSDHSTHIIFPGDVEQESTLVQDFMDTRYQFVRLKGWLPGALDDYDRYDQDPDTSYALRANPENDAEMFAGMRLTRVPTLESSLTWGMMAGNSLMQDTTLNNEEAMREIREAEARGSLWDLTRLVVDLDGHVGISELDDVVLDVFGAGIAASRDGGVEPLWLFLTEKPILNYLHRLGINVSVINVNKVTPTDNYESYLCVVNPEENMVRLQASTGTRDQYAYQRLLERVKTFTI